MLPEIYASGLCDLERARVFDCLRNKSFAFHALARRILSNIVLFQIMIFACKRRTGKRTPVCCTVCRASIKCYKWPYTMFYAPYAHHTWYAIFIHAIEHEGGLFRLNCVIAIEWFTWRAHSGHVVRMRTGLITLRISVPFKTDRFMASVGRA